MEFRSQDGWAFRGSRESRAYLVLLVGPNECAMVNIGAANLSNIILFSEIWDDLGGEIDRVDLLAEIGEDIPRVLSVLKSPTQGKRINKSFVELKSRTE